MIEWEYKDYRPVGFECWETQWDKYRSITVSKLSEDGTRYTVRLYYKDMTEVKQHIDAANWDEARTMAINIIGNYIERHANYWYSLRESFEEWTKVI